MIPISLAIEKKIYSLIHKKTKTAGQKKKEKKQMEGERETEKERAVEEEKEKEKSDLFSRKKGKIDSNKYYKKEMSLGKALNCGRSIR